MTRWQAEDISFEPDEEMIDGTVVAALIATPLGTLRFIAEPELIGSTLTLHRTHLQGNIANQVGIANLHVLAQVLMERLGVDGLIVKGAIRTTGAHPGRQPGALRFIRKVRASPSGRSVRTEED